MAIQRNYSKKTTIGDILFNKTTGSVYFYIKMGFMGQVKVDLVKNEGGTYDILKPYVDNQGVQKSVKLGKTFPVLTKEKTVVEGLTKGTLGLSTTFNKELKREVTTTENALYFTTHKLKEPKVINDTLIKVGFVTGLFGTEADTTQSAAA